MPMATISRDRFGLKVTLSGPDAHVMEKVVNELSKSATVDCDRYYACLEDLLYCDHHGDAEEWLAKVRKKWGKDVPECLRG